MTDPAVPTDGPDGVHTTGPSNHRGGAAPTGRVAVVSGVGPGLGRAIALGLARDGCDVVLAARTATTLEQVAAEVDALGRQTLVVPTDITDPDARLRLVARTVERFGRIDVLAHNAFVQPPLEPMTAASEETFDTAFRTNVTAALQLTAAAVDHMPPGGAVVFTNSMSVRRIRRNFGVYAATKAALLAAAATLARELGPRGIRVNSVLPGYMREPKLEAWFAYLAQRRGISAEEVAAEVAAETALGFIPTPEDVAEAVVFLASPRARAITGAALDVNAGHWVGL